ncbi:outer membrane protein assembly complex, YaeT protein [Catenovulum agarivorans DS-2]|uniref:Outer membrane protein assembly factor BamA n=1 Tax=Catenovulum agarivorans DS-2 TaxID=1328313 RepID=W7QHF9_9ALTE|nr:outer membrane protein assembly factor BamA [Catenovulum agarivorans]EWH11311.1 outer membrane protein assembly complex, YaeT protein [Catenovulum agarivorans DS-2]
MRIKKSILASAVALVLSSQAYAIDEFVIEDIQVNGLQRVALGASLTYIPVQVGDKLTDFRLTQTIKSLYSSGHFDDIEVYQEGKTLIIKVSERPTIAEIEFDGNKDVKEEQLQENLEDQNIRVGEPLDKTTLTLLEKGLEDFYQSIGKYNASVSAKISHLPRNRVKLTFEFTEGKAAKVKQINLVGNTLFDDEKLLSLFESKYDLPWWQFMSNDRYQKQTFSGDIEKLESFYKDQGYVRFAVDSTQVSLTPNKEQVYVTLNLEEGEKYKVKDVNFIGDMVGLDNIIKALVPIRKGDYYSAATITYSEETISNYLGAFGYAYPEVKTIPEIDDETKEVSLTLSVTPGSRINVRRIDFVGNAITDDEVLRRELRQFEGSWLSNRALEGSKARLARLPYIEEVEFETIKLPGESDLVDVVFTIKERPSGSFTAGIGYGDLTGLSLQLGVQQQNFLGTGNSVGVSINTYSYSKNLSLSFTDPYFTVDGVSLGGSVSYSELNYGGRFSNSEDYELKRISSRLTLGYPLDEISRISYGVGYLHNEMSNISTPSEQMSNFYSIYEDADNSLNQLVFDNYEFNINWMQSTLNRGLFPSAGSSQNLGFKVAVPGSDAQFFKITAEDRHYFPLSRDHRWVFMTKASFGYANGYGETDNGHDHVLPIWEMFRAGGSSTMRGFENNVVGPKLFYRSGSPVNTIPDETGNIGSIPSSPEFDTITKYVRNGSAAISNGGNAQALATLELIFPIPFTDEPSSSVRPSFFLDVGNVWDTEFDIDRYSQLDPSELAKLDDYSDPTRYRASAGMSVQWISPMGPIVFSFAKPLKKFDDDDTKFFSFNIGQTF